MRAPVWLAALVLMAAGSRAWAQAEPHYQVELKLNPAHDALQADVTVTLPAGQAQGEQAFLLGDRFHVLSAEADPGVKVTVAPTDQPIPHLQKVTVAFDKASAGPGRVEIVYEGPLDGPGGFDRIVRDGVLEFRVDNFWLPLRSDFGLRYASDLHIQGVPAGLQALGQGQARQSGGEAWLHRTDLDIDLAFVIAGGMKEAAAPGVDFFAADQDSPLVQTFRRHALAAMAFHRAMLGEMPGGPMRVVVVPRTSGSDYQRVGYILLSHRKYEDGITAREDEIRRAHHIAHELAHAWWSVGNPFTEDDWLNESFADYSGLRYVEKAFDRAARQSVLDAARADAEKSGPVIGQGRPSQQALYSRGPILLFDLDERIGRAKMDRLMAQLGRARPRHTAEFLKALAQVAGSAAASDFERRLRAKELILG